MSIFKKETIPYYEFFPKIDQSYLNTKCTPFYLTDTSIICNRYNQIKSSLNNCWGDSNIVSYSFKTNYDIAKRIKKIKPEVFAEVVSEMEFNMAKKNGYKDAEIIYNGPYKKNLYKLLEIPLILNIDNFSEIEKIVSYRKHIKSSIGIRLNTSLKNSRFGFNIENQDALKAILLLKSKGLRIKGIHIHLGFYTDPKIYYSIAEKIIELIKKCNLDIEYIDFGGGFPSHGSKPYGYKQNPFKEIDEYITQMCLPLKTFYSNKKERPCLIVEPGRFLVDDSTVLISKIIDSNHNNKCQTIVIDSTNYMLSSVWYRPQMIEILNTDNSTGTINTIIYGSSCQEDDILYKGKLPILSNNCYIIFYCTGAYNHNMSGNFIFNKPKIFYINE